MNTIQQTVEIPASHRLTIDVPREVPEGRAILTFTPEDETEYLLRSPANREQLSKAVDHIEKGRNLVSFESLEDAIKQAQDRLSR